MNKKKSRAKRFFRALPIVDKMGPFDAQMYMGIPPDSDYREFPMGETTARLMGKYMNKGEGILAIGIDTQTNKIIVYAKSKYFRSHAEMAMHEKYKILVVELGVSNRLRHCLSNANCENVGDIVRCGRALMSKQRNLGAGSMQELDGIMNTLGLYKQYDDRDGRT